MQYLAIDIETTGLNPMMHGITEFAAIESTTSKLFYRWLDPENYVWSNYCLRLHAKWIDRVTDRLQKGQMDALSRLEPKIIKPVQLADDFEEWLIAMGLWKEGDGHPKFTPLGKNVGSFDIQFLKRNTMGDYFRQRELNPAIFYQQPDDPVPPDLKKCKERAIARGAIFNSEDVKHTAIEDALDVMVLYEFYKEQPWLLTV